MLPLKVGQQRKVGQAVQLVFAKPQSGTTVSNRLDSNALTVSGWSSATRPARSSVGYPAGTACISVGQITNDQRCTSYSRRLLSSDRSGKLVSSFPIARHCKQTGQGHSLGPDITTVTHRFTAARAAQLLEPRFHVGSHQFFPHSKEAARTPMR